MERNLIQIVTTCGKNRSDCSDLAGGGDVGIDEGERAAPAARAGQLGVEAVLGGDGDGAV